MKQPLIVARSIGMALGAVLVGAALSACGGGGGALPQTPAAGTSQLQPPVQSAPSAVDGVVKVVSVRSTDRAAANHVKDFGYHLYLRPGKSGTAKPNAVSYPLDLQNHHGHTMPKATQHAIYLNASTGAPWANPMTFLTKLNASMSKAGSFAHVLDQYVGTTASNRYPVGKSVGVNMTIYQDSAGGVMVSENDVLTILHAGVKALGLNNPSYAHEFHIFLPKNYDQCFDYFAQCYSPDYPPDWFFCAWHGSVDFGDLGHVIFSLEPYQGNDTAAGAGCQGGQSLANATASTVSHEEFESISDPDHDFNHKPAWYNPFLGYEMSDNCVTFLSNVTFGGTKYQIQKEYSNKVHGCVP